MRWLAIFGVMLLSVLTNAARENVNAKQKVDVRHCTPKVIGRVHDREQTAIRTRKGEKATGSSPVVAFQILESGEVVHARVKRSSGIADIDTYALNWIKGSKYNARPGCGVIETETSVSIHWISAEKQFC